MLVERQPRIEVLVAKINMLLSREKVGASTLDAKSNDEIVSEILAERAAGDIEKALRGVSSASKVTAEDIVDVLRSAGELRTVDLAKAIDKRPNEIAVLLRQLADNDVIVCTEIPGKDGKREGKFTWRVEDNE